MKRIFALICALMLSFTVTAFAADEDVTCPDCDKSKCTVPRLCKQDQKLCSSAQPCNVLINICQCGPGTFWEDNDYAGVQITSLTEGVYFKYGGYVTARLFREKDLTTVSITEAEYQANWAHYGTVTYTNNNGVYTFKVPGACDWRQRALDDVTTTAPNYLNAPYTYAADVYRPILPTTGPYNYQWAPTQMDYFDADGDLITSPEAKYSSCTLSANSKIDMVQTKKDQFWTLDIAQTGYSVGLATVDDDTDGDDVGVTPGTDDYAGYVMGAAAYAPGEDMGDYLVVSLPEVIVDWAEVEAAGLKGTTATAKVCILDVKGATSGLCSDCAIVCCCEIETVKLCPASRENCIYFPYALYGQQESGWTTGLAVSNISLDNALLSGTQVAIADMSVDFTIIDQTGAVFTKTFAAFEYAIQSFTVDQLIDDMLGLTGVAPGNVYVKVEANFDIDGYEFNILNTGAMSFGSATLPRACVWPAADVFADAYADKLESWGTAN